MQSRAAVTTAVDAVAAVLLALAQRLPAGAAVLAASARGPQPGVTHLVAELEVGDAIAEGDDGAVALVARDERRLRLDGPIPLGGMQIGVADPGGLQLDQDFAVAAGTRCRRLPPTAGCRRRRSPRPPPRCRPRRRRAVAGSPAGPAPADGSGAAEPVPPPPVRVAPRRRGRRPWPGCAANSWPRSAAASSIPDTRRRPHRRRTARGPRAAPPTAAGHRPRFALFWMCPSAITLLARSLRPSRVRPRYATFDATCRHRIGSAGVTVRPRRLSSEGAAQSSAGGQPHIPAARRSASATSAAPSRTAVPRRTRMSCSADAACCQRACSAW